MPRGYPSLTAEQGQEVVSRIKDKGESAPELAKEYGVKPQNIYRAMSHSDQGSEYRSKTYIALLKQFGAKPSMSHKASPWQNGKQEAFYSEFKLELGHPESYPTLGELIEAIARQIRYYNCERIHTALKCLPAAFAVKYQTDQALLAGQVSKNHLVIQDTEKIQSV